MVKVCFCAIRCGDGVAAPEFHLSKPYYLEDKLKATLMGTMSSICFEDAHVDEGPGD